MKTTYNPYTRRFPRGQFIKRILLNQTVHPLYRQAYESDFKCRNPEGYSHDLGAQDVLLDNAGMLFMQQESWWQQYFIYIKILLTCWENLAKQIVPKTPYWGEIFNSTSRDANAGEPRGLLRFMGDMDWVQYATTLLEHGKDAEEFSIAPTTGRRLPAQLEELLSLLLRSQANVPGRFADWDGAALLPSEYAAWRGTPERLERALPPFGGVQLPRAFSPTVDRIRILHPLHSTPDLALRVGCEDADFTAYRKIMRHQDHFMTCCAHAVSVGLDLLVYRQFGGLSRFSPAWLHCRTGPTIDSGRDLGRMVSTLRERLPCSEEVLPYRPIMQQYRQMGHIPADWETFVIRESSGTLTHRFGTPWIREIAPDNIHMIKTYLAAGWVVVVSTFLTEEFFNQDALHDLGLPLAPIYGQHRRRDSGHAWLLVGYDHVDGNAQWKYQGRLYALNSWGKSWPATPVHAPGICSLPFAMLLTEGIEAFAMRFEGKRGVG